MPEIRFNFQGWIVTELTIAQDIDEVFVDVSKMSAEILATKLERGELFISLGDHLYINNDCEIEITDFQGEQTNDISSI